MFSSDTAATAADFGRRTTIPVRLPGYGAAASTEEKYDPAREKTLILCYVIADGKIVAAFQPDSTWACLVKNNSLVT